jgi:hypothetical protein
MMKDRKVWVIFITVFFLLPSADRGALFANAPDRIQKPDYEVKAGIITRIIQYCDWPGESPLSHPNGHFIIGTFEEDDVISYLQQRTESRKIKEKEVKFILIQNDEDIKKCNMIYINDISQKKLKTVLETIGDLPILTVGDDKELAENGVMVSMYRTSKKMAFSVNHTTLRKNHLHLHSRVLSLADKIL